MLSSLLWPSVHPQSPLKHCAANKQLYPDASKLTHIVVRQQLRLRGQFVRASCSSRRRPLLQKASWSHQRGAAIHACKGHPDRETEGHNAAANVESASGCAVQDETNENSEADDRAQPGGGGLGGPARSRANMARLAGSVLMAVALGAAACAAHTALPHRALAEPPPAASVAEVQKPDKGSGSIARAQQVADALGQSQVQLQRRWQQSRGEAQERESQLVGDAAALVVRVDELQAELQAAQARLGAARAARAPREERRPLEVRVRQASAAADAARQQLGQVREALHLRAQEPVAGAGEEDRQLAAQDAAKRAEEGHARHVQQLAVDLVASSEVQKVATALRAREGASGAVAVEVFQAGGAEREEVGEVVGTLQGLAGLGPEQRVQLVRTPAAHVARGLPPLDVRGVGSSGEPAELPEGPAEQQALGWLKWARNERRRLKDQLLASPELARDYAAAKQAEVLGCRDRVLAQVWLDSRQRRWGMPPAAVLDALAHRLLASARFRHDRRAVWVRLKADPRDFFVDLAEFDASEEARGGTQWLYLRARALGVPSSVEVMWIPLADWDPWRLLQLPFRTTWWGLQGLWGLPQVQQVWPWYRDTATGVVEEIFLRFVYPAMPRPLRVALSLEYGEAGGEVSEASMAVLGWLAGAEERLQTGTAGRAWVWWISLSVRVALVGYPLYYLVLPPLRSLLSLLRPSPFPESEVQYKKRIHKEVYAEFKRETEPKEDDPVKYAFDRVRRVRDPVLRRADLPGMEGLKEEVDAVVNFLRNPARYRELGARPPRGVLITGGPGTGKTSVAYAIAAEAGVPMVELEAMDIQGNKFVGQGATNVRELFKVAREMAPIIVFIENFEQLAPVRGRGLDVGKQEQESMLNQLLVELDGFETQEGVVLMGTSSRPGGIDPALLRPGRMDIQLALGLPQQAEREAILRNAAERTLDPRLAAAVDWRDVAEHAGPLTPADLQLIPAAIERAATGLKPHDKDELRGVINFIELYLFFVPAFLQNTQWFLRWEYGLMEWLGLAPSAEDIRRTVRGLDFTGISRPGLELDALAAALTREDKFPHAVWAAGRGLLAALLPEFDSPETLWLSPDSGEGIAFTRLQPWLDSSFRDAGVQPRSYQEKRLTLLFGSHCAAVLLLPFGQANTLASRQLEEAQELAARMVVQHGWARDSSPLVYQTPEASRTLAMGEGWEVELEARTRELHDLACNRAGEILSRNRRTLEALVELLCQVDVVDRETLEAVMRETGATAEDAPFELVPYQDPMARSKARSIQLSLPRLAEPAPV